MEKMIKALVGSLTMLTLAGCGIKIEGPGDVRVLHEVSLSSIEPYVTAYCQLGNALPADVTACVSLELGKLINKL